VYGRPGLVVSPPVTSIVDGVTYTNQSRRFVTKYYDNASPNNAFQVEVISDLNQQGDGLLKSRTTTGQMGQTVLTESSEDGSTYTISRRTVYDPMGRVTYSSNPYRSGAASTDGWTRTTRDNAGRVIEVATFNTATQPPSTGTNANWTGSATTSYNAEKTTVTDQAGKSRRSIVDGLGRLKQIIEDPSGTPLTTTYGYDVLGNLTSVAQGVQTRTFTYDSLSRLREAYNPEQVDLNNQQTPTVYQYNENSALLSKTNPNSTSVSFEYDGLSRVKKKTVSTGGVWDYSYDTGTNGKGRLVSVILHDFTDGNYYDGYDAVGKLTGSHQITTGQSYSFTYGYNLAGGMTTEVYPSLREIRTSYDNAGRVAGVKNQGSGLYYAGAVASDNANRIQYTAHGAMSAMKLGNGKWEHTSFNGRLQPLQIGLGTSSGNSSLLQLDYTYGSANNNGNVQTQTITVGATVMSQSYTYDSLNRLWTATETGAWLQNYGYDRYGNRWLASGYIVPGNEALTPQLSTDFNTSTNRLTASLYDTSGNQTRDQAGRGFTYDAENHQVTFNINAGVYSYDGNGQRVKKIDSTGTTVFAYNASGQLIAEYHSEPVPPGAGGGGTSYLTSDHLGSTRVVTDASGNVRARHDYLPFGEELPSNVGSRGAVSGYGGADNVRQKFTQKERDSESGLDYFLARYYSSGQGRFTGVDPGNGGSNADDPQSWNGYAYARSNPLLYGDPDGREYVIFAGNGYGILPDVVFESERDHFRGENYLIFTGNRQPYERGDIISPEGEVVASYAQISIDDNARHLIDEVHRNIRDVKVWARAGTRGILYGLARHYHEIRAARNRAPGAPALKGDPYHPDSVQERVHPPYETNPAHDRHSPSFNPQKTPEPPDAALVYDNSVRTDFGVWYGKSPTGEYYRFFSDNAGKVHFSATVPPSQVPSAAIRQLE
jgi:RHS repeat-associated protein